MFEINLNLKMIMLSQFMEENLRVHMKKALKAILNVECAEKRAITSIH